MGLQYPLEVTNTYDAIRGQGHFIGECSVLFPCFKPKTDKNITQYIDDLSDRSLYVDANVVRRTDSIVVLTTPCSKYAYNHLLFADSATDEDILGYLRKYKGWKPALFANIKKSLQYKKSRRELDIELYSWEHANIPHVTMPFNELVQIVDAEVEAHSLTTPYEVVKRKDSDMLGDCSIYRRAGWLASPFKVVIGLNKAHLFLHITLHEIAHMLAAHYYRSNTHSPVFLLLYANLLKKYMNINFLPSMQEHGLFQGYRNAR